MADKILEMLNSLSGQLEDKSLYVGFIDGATYPDGTQVAQVAMENEYGVPERNVPSRPFFRNAIALHESEWADLVSRGLMAGKDVNTVLEVAGAVVAADVRGGIIQLMDPPIAAYTAKKRRERGNTSTKPLEDTKTMLNDVTYEIRDERNESS